MFFDELDEEITKSNVNRLLNNYHRVKRLAGVLSPKITATYSMVPRSETGVTSNSTHNAVAMKLEAQEKFDKIEKAFNSLTGDSRRRLYFKYIAEDRLYDYQIYNAQNIGKDTYYRELGKAQIEFAEAYNDGELLFFYSKKSD